MKQLNERAPMAIGEELLREGEQLQKMEVGAEQFYQTAIQVAKPRSLQEVQMRCLEEAEVAGELFYYSWTVRKKDGTRGVVDGVSIHGAMAIARNFGNCAVPVTSEEEGDAVQFRAAFVDLETGFTVARIFRAHFVEPPGRFRDDPDQAARWRDMQFQKAQSQAQRNVILKGVPYYLVELVRKTAQQSAFQDIKKMGLPKARKQALEGFGKYGIPQQLLEEHLGVAMDKWTQQNIVNLRSILRAFDEGLETVESVFGHEFAAKDEKDKEQLKARFWELVGKKGIKKGDKDMIKYLEEVAKFGQMSLADYVADLVAAFEKDPGEVDKFIKTFQDRKAKAPPQKQEPEKEGGKKEEKQGGQQLLTLGSDKHKALEAIIEAYKVDKGLFDEFLLQKGFIDLKDGKPDYGTMTEEKVRDLIDHWNAWKAEFDYWVANKDGGAQE